MITVVEVTFKGDASDADLEQAAQRSIKEWPQDDEESLIAALEADTGYTVVWLLWRTDTEAGSGMYPYGD